MKPLFAPAGWPGAASDAGRRTRPPMPAQRQGSRPPACVWDMMGYHGIIWASMDQSGAQWPRRPAGLNRSLTVRALKEWLKDVPAPRAGRAGAVHAPGNAGCAATAVPRRCSASRDREQVTRAALVCVIRCGTQTMCDNSAIANAPRTPCNSCFAVTRKPHSAATLLLSRNTSCGFAVPAPEAAARACSH